MPGSSRRKSRIAALKALYAVDVGGQETETAIENEVRALNMSEEAESFAEGLVRGTMEKLPEIDPIIGDLASGYSLDRIAAVDRALLRLAVYEILFEPDVPPAVAINEAVELAKKYSTEESGAFVNGILGALIKKRRLEPHGA